jgi:hypothetical protein
MKYLKYIDNIGYSPQLTMEGNKRFQTIFGGFISIITIILIVLASISFGRDIYERKSPSIRLDKQLIVPTLEMSPKIAIGARLYYDGSKTIPELERLIDVHVLYYQYNGGSTNITRYETNRCNESKIYNENFMNITKMMPYPNEYFCLPDNQSFLLKEKSGGTTSKFVLFRFGMCQNSTNNNNSCYPEEVICFLLC